MIRGRSLKVAIVCALAALLVVPAASADWKSKWSNGHKIEDADGKFKLKFGGRIQADYHFEDCDPGLDCDGDGFEFRRARLFFSGTIYERVEFKAQYDFAGGDADFKDVWIALKTGKAKVQFGHFKEFFSLEELTSSKYLAFLERSLNNAFAPGRNSGVGFEGKSDKVTWGIGAYYDADGFGVSTSEDNINYTARVVFRPLFEDKGKNMFHIGIAATQKDRASSIRFRVRPEAHFTNRFVDTRSFSADDAMILGLELAGVHNNFWWAAEYNQADVSTPIGPDPTFDGGYVQVGYIFGDNYRRYKTSAGAFDRQKPDSNWGMDDGKGAWEIAFRYSTIDLTDGGINGGEMDDITVGVNWYLNPATRLMMNYVMADVDQVGDADFILVRWQVDF